MTARGSLTTPFVALSVLSGAFALALALLTWRRREADGARSYAVLLVFLAVWAPLYAGQLLAPTVAAKTAWLVVRHASAPAIAVLFWGFTSTYTARPELRSARYLVPIVAAGGLLTATVVLNPGGVYLRGADLFTGGSTPRLRPRYGPAFWFHVGYLFAVIGAGHVYIVDLMRRTFRAYRTQLAVLAATGVIEFSLLFVQLTDHVRAVPALNPFPYVDTIVFGTVLLAVPITWSYANEAYFHLQPLGRETVMEHVDDAVLVFDANDRCVYHNAAAADLLGTDPDAVDDRTADALLDARPSIRAHYRAVRADGGGADGGVEGPVPVDRADGARYYDLELSAVRNASDERVGTALVARDVTRLHRQTERLDAFAGTISHDLQNPLHTAQGYLELARDDTPEHLDRVDDSLGRVDDSLDRIEEIIETLLTIARAKGHLETTEPTPLDAAVSDAWEAVDDADAATLRRAFPADLRIDADPALVRTILENLLRNAVDHGSTGSRTGSDDAACSDSRVTITVGDITVDGEFEGFYVADDGPGIPAERRDRAFEYGHTTADGGTGVGLTIVRDAVEAHGWEVDVIESAAGGARFEVSGVDRVG